MYWQSLWFGVLRADSSARGTLLFKRRQGHTEADRDVELFLANEQVDQIADYASRGRVYERLTDGELAEKWINAFRQFADAPSDERRRAIEIDLKAEFQL
jgi:hypothetical protein